MIIQKSHVVPIEWGTKNLGRKFRDAGLTGRRDNIDGFNVFTAVCDPALRGTLGIKDERPFALNRREWNDFWTKAGISAPGALPSGCLALVSFSYPAEGSEHKRVEVGEIIRSSGPLGSGISVGFAYGAENNTSQGPALETFAVAVIPKTIGGWTYSLSGGVSLQTGATLFTDHLAGAAAAEANKLPAVSLLQSLKRAAGFDKSPQALGLALLKEHHKCALQAEASPKCLALVNAGADLTLRDAYGQTIFMKAAGYGQVELTKLLISKGVNLDETASATGSTAQDMAQEVADNVKDRKDAGSVQDYQRFKSVVDLITAERAARAATAQAQADKAATVLATPLAVSSPLKLKKGNAPK